MQLHRAGRAVAGAALVALLAAAPAHAASSARIGATITPNHGPVGKPLSLTTSFSFTPTDGGTGDTLSKMVLQLPKNGRWNGKLFPSCDPAAINRARSYAGCPKGSLIGRGRVKADVPAIPVNDVPATLTIFNGPGGKSLTVHVYATNPVLIKTAFKAPIVKTGGRYGYKVTFDLPYILQEISPGWFAVENTINARIGATRTIRGRKRGIIESATLCPKSNGVPFAAQFSFLRGPSTSAQSTIRCHR